MDVMTFEVPPEPTDTASFLRDLEQNCPKTTPKEVRAALLRGAQELEDWQRLAKDAANQLEEASRLHVGQMASQSRADEVTRQVKLTMTDLATRFRELA
jgi:hypothetical protein